MSEQQSQGCAACAAELANAPAGFTWLVGFAAGVRCAIQNAGVLCPAHAVDYERVRRVFGHPQLLIENLPDALAALRAWWESEDKGSSQDTPELARLEAAARALFQRPR